MQRILEPGELEKPLGDIEETLLPPADIFAQRAERCRKLATKDGPLAAYLSFVAHLGALQQKELDALQKYVTRDEGFSPSPYFVDLVKRLAEKMQEYATEKSAVVFRSLLSAETSLLYEQAVALAAGHIHKVSAATAPLIGAALQIEWVGHVLLFKERPVARRHESSKCPLCNSAPVAGFIDGPRGGLRYLHCSLCGSAWHMVRAKCSCCGESKAVNYFFSEEIVPYVRIEACSSCKSYLKLFLTEKEANVDPWADDLFSFALDLQMAERGLLKNGINILQLAE